MALIIGNIIALIGSILMVYVGVIKDKKGILFVQSLQIALLAISNLVLNGISGFIINTINLIRNIICYKEALSLKVKILLSIISIILTIYFNNLYDITIQSYTASLFDLITIIVSSISVIKLKTKH